MQVVNTAIETIGTESVILWKSRDQSEMKSTFLVVTVWSLIVTTVLCIIYMLDDRSGYLMTVHVVKSEVSAQGIPAVGETECILGNICIYPNSTGIYTYHPRSDFYHKIDAPLNVNVKMNNTETVVPDIVHFTWYGGLRKGNHFRFHHLISILAAHKHVKPRFILFWHDMVPEGSNWIELKQKVPELRLVFRPAPRKIRGRNVDVPEHLTDVVRLEAMIEYGGVYFDLDAIVVKPLDRFFIYDVTMGYETPGGLCNGIMIGKPWADFFRLWHGEYKTFNDNSWAYHSVQLPAILARKHPNLLHTEVKSLHRPNWSELRMLYGEGHLYNWRENNYALHLWIRFHHVEHNAQDIRVWNTTVGEVFRYIYYGDWAVKKG